MHVERGRLLILVALLSVVCAASWSTSLASGTLSSDASSTWSQLKPHAAPTSGEPDVGQTPHPDTQTGLQSPGSRGGEGGSSRHRTDNWFSWAYRILMMRLFGAR